MDGLRQAGGRAEMSSCDSARNAWFAAALRHGSPPAPDAAALAGIREIREGARSDAGGGACALEAAFLLEQYFGWPCISGVYLAGNGEPIALHTWNLLSGGGILDATADRFGEGHDIRTVLPGDPDWSRYRLEWTRDPQVSPHSGRAIGERKDSGEWAMFTKRLETMRSAAKLQKVRERHCG